MGLAGLTWAQTIPIKVVDVGGALNLLQNAIGTYRDKNPGVTFVFAKELAPDLPRKLQSGETKADLVLGGTDILAAGIDQKLWTRLLPEHARNFPAIMEKYFKESRKMQELANGEAFEVVYSIGGPLLEYNPDAVPLPPATPAELLNWCQAHPGRFTYAQPANSGPGRTFLMGLPYLLDDKDPKDPVYGWERTWAFLKALDKCIDVYPTSTGALMKELGNGKRDMTVSTTGWDINQRAIGIVPKHYKVKAFTNLTWINDAQYMMVPKGLSPQRLTIVLDLMAHLLKREQQAYAYDKGYFYPGPAIKNVPFVLAPEASQKVLREFGRAEYIQLGLERPHVQPLSASMMVKAFKIWSDEIGSTR
nr:extracellular solute-binding protein [Rhodoferax sp.]